MSTAKYIQRLEEENVELREEVARAHRGNKALENQITELEKKLKRQETENSRLRSLTNAYDFAVGP